MSSINLAQLNWVDYAIVGTIFLSTIISFIRGFVREAISLATWIIAAWLAFSFSGPLAAALSQWIISDLLRLVIAFAGIFIIALILGALVNYTISQLVSKTGLSGTDRLLGTVFGCLRGILLVGIMLLLIHLTLGNKPPEWLTESQLAARFDGLTAWLQGFLPEHLENLSESLKTSS